MIYTDRSRFLTYFKCPFKRFMNYHYLGKGIVRRGLSIPLATGSHTHSAIEYILNIVKSTNDLPRANDVRDIIEEVNSNYRREVADSNFLGLEDNERADHIVNEQTTLISGLIWAWAVAVLPSFLEHFAVLHVEQEMEKIIGCDCGLSNIGEVRDHIPRGCNGVVIMTRPDLVAEVIDTGSVAYVEMKTGSKIDSNTFEGDVQFAFGAVGVEGFTGKELSESYVHALSKGYRKNEYNPDSKKYDKPPYQHSSLCYAYVSGGISGLVPQNISFKYTSRKGYKRTPVWEIAFKDIPEGVPPTEHYISMMSDEELESHAFVFGPYPYPKQQVEEMVAEIEHLEKHNAEIFDWVEGLVMETGLDGEDTQEALRKYVPKSWFCKDYNQMCPYRPVCTKAAGWEEPLSNMTDGEGNPLYEIRAFNHPVEGEEVSND